MKIWQQDQPTTLSRFIYINQAGGIVDIPITNYNVQQYINVFFFDAAVHLLPLKLKSF